MEHRPGDWYSVFANTYTNVANATGGGGEGETMRTPLVPADEAPGFSKLFARNFPENRASLALCARHGFRIVGTYEKHGRLDGAWRDVVIVERLFDANLD